LIAEAAPAASVKESKKTKEVVVLEGAFTAVGENATARVFTAPVRENSKRCVNFPMYTLCLLLFSFRF
jgi:hypothetical protein